MSGSEGFYLETWEGVSALYKTTEGSLAFAWAAFIREQMGLSRPRKVARCHMCLGRQRPSSVRSWREHGCPWALGVMILPRRHKAPLCPRCPGPPSANTADKSKSGRTDVSEGQLAGRIGKNPDQINDLTYHIVRVEGHGPGGMQQPWFSLSGSPFFLFFLIFILMWTIFKVFIVFVTILLLFHILVFWP